MAIVGGMSHHFNDIRFDRGFVRLLWTQDSLVVGWFRLCTYHNIFNLSFTILLYGWNSSDMGCKVIDGLGIRGGLQSFLYLRYPSRPSLGSDRVTNLLMRDLESGNNSGAYLVSYVNLRQYFFTNIEPYLRLMNSSTLVSLILRGKNLSKKIV